MASTRLAVRGVCGVTPRSRRAVSNATVNRPSPTRPTITSPVTAQWGSFAVAATYATSSAIGKRSNSRCAKTVPSSVALVPLPCGR